MQFCPVLDFSRPYKKVLFEEEKGLIRPHWAFQCLKVLTEKRESNYLHRQIVIGKGQWF